MMIYNKIHPMIKTEEIKDVRVTIDCWLRYEKHANGKIETTNTLVGTIRQSFMFLAKETFVPLYKALVCSHLNYAMAVRSPHLVKYINAIEGVQRRATKIIPTLKNLAYPERLKKLKLPKLAYRRARGDMIEVYKIVNGI